MALANSGSIICIASMRPPAAIAAAASTLKYVEIARAAPLINVPTIDKLSIRVLVDQQHDQFLRGSTVNGVVHEGARASPQRADALSKSLRSTDSD